MKKKIKKNFLRSIGILIFLFIIVFKVNLTELYSTVQRIEIKYLIVFLIIFLLATPLNPFRWKYILKKMNIKINFINSYSMVFISMLIGLATPAKIGEIGGRISFFLKQKNLINKAVSAITLEKIIDIIFLLFFAIIVSLFFINLLPFYFNLITIIILFIFLVIISLFLKNKLTITKKFISFIIPPKYKNFHRYFNKIRTNFKLINTQDYFVIFALSSLLWLITFFITYIFAKGVGINIPFIYFAMASAVATLSSLIPISVSGLGIRETVYIILFIPFNVSIEKIITFSLASTLSLMLLLALIGCLCWMFKKKISITEY